MSFTAFNRIPWGSSIEMTTFDIMTDQIQAIMDDPLAPWPMRAEIRNLPAPLCDHVRGQVSELLLEIKYIRNLNHPPYPYHPLHIKSFTTANHLAQSQPPKAKEQRTS